MKAVLKPGWSKPSAILFAAEIPVNEKAFTFALAQAVEFGATLILFHAYDTLVVTESESSGIRYYDSAAAAHIEVEHMAPLAARVAEAGVACETVVRSGLPAEQILAYLSERKVDRVVMGTHSPGTFGRLLVGSVAEEVLRSALTPVCVIGPEVVSAKYRNFSMRTIMCGVSLHESSAMVVRYAAELAAEQGARLILQHMIRPQDRAEILAGRSVDQIEAEMVSLVPHELKGSIVVQSIVVSGDPAEELLYWSSAEQADQIVLGAQGASAFAALTCHGVVYKMLAHAPCPVITLSPVILEAGSAKRETARRRNEVFLAGVF